MMSLQFGAIRPTDLKNGAALVSNDDEGFAKTLYLLTGEPGTPQHRIADGKRREQVAVPLTADRYEEQADGSFRKVETLEEGTPMSFPVQPGGEPLQTRFDLAEVARKEGDRLWLKA